MSWPRTQRAAKLRGWIWRGNKQLNRLRLNWQEFKNLAWSLQRLRQDLEKLKQQQWGHGEVAGDAYARSRRKDTVSDFSIRRLNQLEEEVRDMRTQMRLPVPEPISAMNVAVNDDLVLSEAENLRLRSYLHEYRPELWPKVEDAP